MDRSRGLTYTGHPRRTRLHLLLAAAAMLFVSAGCGSTMEASEADAVSEQPASTLGDTVPTTSSSTPASDPAPIDRFSCSPAPSETSEIRIGTEHAVGDSFDLELRLERTGSGVPFEAVGVTPIRVEVESADERGSLLRWRSEATSLTGAGIPTAELERAGLSLDDAPRQNILYRIDGDGFFAGIENIEELRESALAGLDFFSQVLPDDGSLEALASLYANMGDDEIAAVFGEELLVYHGLDGLVLKVGESLQFDDWLPNALGGDPFPATTELTVATLAGDGGCAEVIVVTSPDGEEFARIMWESVEQAFGQEVDEADVITAFDVRNEIVASIDVLTGTVMRVQATQTVTTMGESRTELATITRI